MPATARPLGIEYLSVFGLPPVALVTLAADLGCQHISLGLDPGLGLGMDDYNPHRYPGFSLRDDKQLRRDLIAAMADRGVSVSNGEGLYVRRDRDVSSYAPDLDVMLELGVPRINTVSMEGDKGRTLDQLGKLADMTAAVGVETLFEFTPSRKFGSLTGLIADLRSLGRPNLKLMIDTMHLFRTGAWATEAEALDPAMVGYIQLSDCPLAPRFDSYAEEANFERMAPGEGELPLQAMLRALPRDVPVGLEIPIRSLADAGVDPHARLKPCVDGARRLLAQIDQPSVSSR
jgi:sugar phosphate isomerase/epimerase